MSFELVAIDDICELVRGSSPRPQGDPRFFGGSVPRLMVADMTRDGMYVTPSIDSLTEEGAKQSRPMKAGELVMVVSGVVGLPSILKIDACIHDGLVGFRNLDKKVLPEYLYYWLLGSQEKSRAQTSGAIWQNLTTDQIKEWKLPLPPLTEQKQIASLLARADRLRQLRRTAHDLGDALLQSVFLEMFGDPFRNEKGWERIEIAELIRSGDTINYGVVQPGDDFPNGTPVIRVGDLDNLDKDITSLKLIDPKIEASYKRSRIVGDEILIACVGSIGKIALATEKMKGFNIVRAVARVPADYSLVNRLFLAAYLSMPIIQDFFQRETRTVAQPTLNITQIEETPILMPPLSLQEEFAGVVARVESLRRRMGESTRGVEGLFESLLIKSFGE